MNPRPEAEGRVLRGARKPPLDQPHRSLLVCFGLLALQVLLLPVLLAIDDPVLTVLGIAWLLLPLGALYGIRLARLGGPMSDFPWLRRIAVAANGLYLTLGVLLWLLVIVSAGM